MVDSNQGWIDRPLLRFRAQATRCHGESGHIEADKVVAISIVDREGRWDQDK